MTPLSPWPIVIVFVLVLATAWLLTKRFPLPPTAGRFSTLDGLRGFLAFGVYTHHGVIWYFFVRSGKWEPPGGVYATLGENSVALFFMITGFLFWTKLLDGRARKDFDWTRLYVSRVLRLAPSYYFALAVAGLFLAFAVHFQLRVPVPELAMEIIRWASFTILHDPTVNGFADTSILIAGVAWTLPYEWLFYCALPLCGFLVGVRSHWLWLVAAAVVTAEIILHLRPEPIFLAAFGGGILAAYVVRSRAFCATARSPYATALAVLALGTPILAQLNLRNTPALLLLTVAFAIIAGGNSLVGILTLPAARLAGEITYSVYVLHGLVLYAAFRFILGTTRAAALSPLQHWLIIFAGVPVIVLGSCLTFRWIEMPAIRSTARVTQWIKARQTSRV